MYSMWTERQTLNDESSFKPHLQLLLMWLDSMCANYWLDLAFIGLNWFVFTYYLFQHFECLIGEIIIACSQKHTAYDSDLYDDHVIFYGKTRMYVVWLQEATGKANKNTKRR